MSVALALAAGVGCDAADPVDGPAAERADSHGGDAVDAVDAVDGEQAGDSEVAAEVSSAPSAALEEFVSLPGLGGAGRDDLFPDLSGDDLVWVQMWLDQTVPGATAETDCGSCPYCAGCRFDLMYRHLPDGPVETLYASNYARMGPKVGEGVATWIDDNGVTYMRDLARGETKAVPIPAWASAPPVAHGGKLWWWGYEATVSNYGINAYDRATGLVESGLQTYLQDPTSYSASPLANLARRQPFVVSDEGIWFALWDGTLAIRRWPFGGNPETVLKDPTYSYLRVLPRDGGVVTLGYDTAGCQPSTCELAFLSFEDAQLRIGGTGSALASDAAPTRYVAPMVDGDRIVWLDHRDGPYMIYGVDSMGDEQRITSDDAEIGAVSTIAASRGRVVWADRRTGHWRIMARDW